MSSARVEALSIAEGDRLAPGSRLFDARVDLSAVAPQDCPPVYFFRVVSREGGWVRRLSAETGAAVEVEGVMAVVTTEPDEPIDGPAARPMRVAAAAIMAPSPWFGTGQ